MIKIEKPYDVIPDCFENPKIEEHISKIVENNDEQFSWHILDYAEVEKWLVDLYHNKCAYCETLLDKVELLHYRPFEGPYTCRGYKSLAYEWSNLLPVCPKCKELKGNKFPILNKLDLNSLISKEKRKPNIFPLKDEIPKILNPEIDNPVENFYFKPNGGIYHKNERANYTKICFQLNRFDIQRKIISDTIFQALYDFTYLFFNKQITETAYINLVTTKFNEIKRKQSQENQFTAYTNYLYKNFEIYAESHIPDEKMRDEIIHAFNCFKNKQPIKLQYFSNLITNSLKTLISNNMSIDGDGNISWQNVDNSKITINYNNSEEFVKIIEEFRSSQKIEHNLIAIQLEAFNNNIEKHRKSQDDNSSTITKLREDVSNYNINVSLLLQEIDRKLSLGVDDIMKLLQLILIDMGELKKGQKHISDKLVIHYSYLVQIPDNNKDIKDIQAETNKLIFELNDNLAEGLSEHLSQIFDYIDEHFDDLDQKQQQIYKDLKKSDNWQTKIKFAIPLINLIGIKVEHDVKLNSLIKRIRKKKKSV